MLYTAGYLWETKFLQKKTIEVTWATFRFRNITWQAEPSSARKFMNVIVIIENISRGESMISLCGTYFYLENHQFALVKLDRKDFHTELEEKPSSGKASIVQKSFLITRSKKGNDRCCYLSLIVLM